MILHPNKDSVSEILNYLDHHIEDHFKEEELFMKDHLFKEQDAHLNEHNQFRTLIKSINKEAKKEHSNLKLSFLLRQFIDQLIHHIIHTDVKLSKLTKLSCKSK